MAKVARFESCAQNYHLYGYTYRYGKKRRCLATGMCIYCQFSKDDC